MKSPAPEHPVGFATPPQKNQASPPTAHTQNRKGGGIQVITITSWRVSEDTLVQNRQGQEGGRPRWQHRPSLFQ